MAPNTIAAEISGLILWHGAAQAVRVERSLLMFDAVRWARWIATQKREEAARCEREGGIRAQAEINHQVREIDRWLVTGKGGRAKARMCSTAGNCFIILSLQQWILRCTSESSCAPWQTQRLARRWSFF